MGTFLQEIQQQPETLRSVFDFYSSDEGKKLFQELKSRWNSQDCTRVLFAGMGSSCYLSHTAAMLMDGKQRPVMAMDAGELLHDAFQSLVPGTLLVLISQSGESYEIKALLDAVRNHDIALQGIVGITNDPSSTLARKAGLCFPLLAGTEEATSTKTFVATFFLVLMMDRFFKDEPLEKDSYGTIIMESERLVAVPERFVSNSAFLGACPFVQCIGRGIFRTVSEQTSLMFMEVTKIPSAASSGGAFRHGPIEAVEEGFMTVVFTHSGCPTYEQTLGLVSDLLLYGGNVLLLTDRPSGFQHDRLHELYIRCNDPELAAPLYVMPMQLLLAEAASRKGLEPGTFSHGHKITGIE